jgi:Tol biopolymer transport system component
VRRMTLAWSVVLLSMTLSISFASAAHAAFPGGNGDIAFSRSIHGQSDIWVVRPGVTGTVNRTNTPHRLESQPDYNAAGTRIAYTRCTEEFSNCDLWAMDADGANKTRLTFTPAVQET